jgi:hypothetical protein
MPMFFSLTRMTHDVLCERIKEADTGDAVVDAGLYLLSFPIMFVNGIPWWFLINIALVCSYVKITPDKVVGLIGWFINHSCSKARRTRIKNALCTFAMAIRNGETQDRWKQAQQQP